MPNVLTVLSSLFNGDREFVDAATNEPLAVSITFVSYCGEWAAGRQNCIDTREIISIGQEHSPCHGILHTHKS
jgi:hypothetical protein